MKKRTLIVAALLAAMTVGANAQENLALNKEATASSNTTAAGWSVDGNTGTRWEQSGESAGDVANADNFWYSVDLGESKAFNTIQIVWENDNVKQFEIQTSTDGNTWRTVYTSPEETGYGKVTKTYQIGDQEAQYVKIKATELNGQNYFSFWEFRVYNRSTTSVLTSVKPSVFFVNLNTPTEVTFKYLNQYGDEMEIENPTFTVSGGTYEGGKLTATQAGNVTITATADNKSATATVYALGEAPTLTLNTEDYDYKGIYGAATLNGVDNENVGWNSGYKNADVIGEMSIDGTPAMQVANLQNILIGKLNDAKNTVEWGLTNEDEYTDVKIALFPDRDVTATFRIETSAGDVRQSASLEGGKWNYITASGFSNENTFKYFDVECNAVDGEYPNMLISNVYLQKEKGSGVVENVKISAKPNARGFYVVSGKATNLQEINDKLTDKGITAYDLTKLDISGVTEVCTLTPANPNALIYVKAAEGKGGNDFEPAQNWGETKNVVGFNGNSADEYYKPATGINFVDGYAVYQGWFISAGDRAVNYTRSLNAGDCVSTFLPRTAEIPAGCKAYEFVKGSDDNTIDLNEVTALSENTPYVIYNGSSDKVDLTCAATGDVYFTKGIEEEKKKELGNVTVMGNYSYFAGDGTQYVLDATSYNATTGVLTLKKCTEKTTVVPFRVYFTLKDATNASVVKFMLPGTVTGINDVKANAQKAADVYSIDGRLVKKAATSVEGLASGVYIMNGKKYVVK